jgi:hypothetical protein
MSCQSEKKGPSALSGVWGKGDMGIVCYKTDGAVRAHSAGPSSGADVRGGIVGPSVCIEDTDLQYYLPSVTTNVTRRHSKRIFARAANHEDTVIAPRG